MEKKKMHSSLARKLAPLLFLLMIPLQLVMDAGILYLGSKLDNLLFSTGAYGHPIPIFFMLTLILVNVITGVVTAASIILTVVFLIKRFRA